MKRRLCNIKGFTLLEIMLATLILTIVVGAIYSAFRAGLSAWRRADRKYEMYQNAQGVLNQLGRELRSSFISAQTSVFNLRGEKDYLDFYSTLKNDADENEPDLSHMVYFVSASQFSEGNSVWRHVEYGPFINEPSEEENAEINTDELKFNSEEVADGLKEFKLQFFNGDAWTDEWGSQEEDPSAFQPPLPRAVRIIMVMKDNAGVLPDETFYTEVDVPLAEAFYQAAEGIPEAAHGI